MNQLQLQVIDHLREENRVLPEQLGGTLRPTSLEESASASALAIGRHRWFPIGSSASKKAHKTAKGIKGLYPYTHSLAGPKARQEDHYEPFGSIDASTVLYRLALGTDQFFDC